MESSDSLNTCPFCDRPKAQYTCDVCQSSVCSRCQEVLPPETFSFLPKIPETLSHSRYCPDCFAEHVEPARSEYEEKMKEARDAFFFFKTQKRIIPVLRRANDMVAVQSCPDRDETILRLGFLAIEKGYNAIIEAEVVGQKVRMGAYQKMSWSGRGLPAQVDRDRLERVSNRSPRVFED